MSTTYISPKCCAVSNDQVSHIYVFVAGALEGIFVPAFYSKTFKFNRSAKENEAHFIDILIQDLTLDYVFCFYFNNSTIKKLSHAG